MAANSINSDVNKVFKIFGKCMFKEFDQMFASIHDKVNQKVSSTTCTALKFTADLVPSYKSPLRATEKVVTRAVDEVKDAFSLWKATKMESLAYKWSDAEEGVQMKETLCQAALVLYVSFYPNITRVTTKEGTDRKAIETLAQVAVSNFENWYTKQPDKKPFSVELITEGVTANLETKLPSLYKQPEVYDKVTKTEYDPIKLFTKPALVVDDGINAQTYFEDLSRKHPLKYGYRFLFEHELRNKSVVLNGYEQLVNPELNLVKPELETGIWRELLNAIREQDPNLMESRLKEHMVQALRYNYRTADVDIDYCPAPVDTFVGRQDQLQTLKTMFTQHQVVALVGLGGLGKTQLSRKYVLDNKAEYQYKYWLESETPEKLENSFKKLAKKLHIESDNIDEVVNDVYKKLQAVPTILVFDNVENSADVYAYLPTRVDLPPEVTIHVLVTSRWTDWSCDKQIECYKLQPFNMLESLEIFVEYFGKSCIETMKNKWEELAQMLGYLPLALKITAPAIHKLCKHNSNLGTVLADYMKQISEGAGRLLKYPLTEYANRTIYESMLLPLKQFENKTDDEWKLAVTLINAAAYMDPDGIRKESLLKLSDSDENTWILDEALVILTEYSLFDQVVNSDEKYYTVHRILQASIRHYHIENGTADMYYTVALRCELASDYRPSYQHSAHVGLYPMTVLRYANERASAVVAYYKENLSSTLFIYLVECQAIIAVQAVFQQMTTNQIQSVIQQQDLLYYAVWSQNLAMIQLLYSNGADINQVTNELGIPPLHLALQLQNMEISKWLLENGATPSLRDRYDCTALHVAFMLGMQSMVIDIIKTDKAAVHAVDNNGSTPLLSMHYNSNNEDFFANIQVLLENGADITAVNIDGDTVLHSAARKTCAPAVSLILEEHRDLINIVNKNGKTALHEVCHNVAFIGEPDSDTGIDNSQRLRSTIRVLVENGADLTKVDSQGNTVLHSAAEKACVEAVSVFLQLKKDLINIVNKDGRTALHEVCQDVCVIDQRICSTIRVLVENGADLTKVDIDGNTVLHMAARASRAGPVSLILQLNEDLINIVNKHGKTALLEACGCLYKEDESIVSTIRVLVENGADLTKVDTRGNTVLHLAAGDACAAAVSLLLQLKKDLINIVNVDGQTALHVILFDITYFYVKDESILQTIRVLVESGVDLMKVDSCGNTVLHLAVGGACAAAVSLLLELKEDLINIVNEDGQTALHVLGKNIHPFKHKSEQETIKLLECVKNVIQVLIRNGLSLDSRDNKGCTPLDTVKSEYKDILLQVASGR